MEREEIGPLSAAISFAENIHLMLDRIRSLIEVAILSFSLFAVFGVLSIVFPGVSILILGPLFVGLLLMLLSVFPNVFHLRKELELWDKTFMRFSCALKFETYPPEGETHQEKVFNQLLKVFVELKGILSEYLEKVPEGFKDFTNVKFHGKRGEYVFDVYVGDEALRDKKDKIAVETRSKLRDFTEKHGNLFLKRFDKKEPLNAEDLSNFGSEISDVVRKTRTLVFRAMVVSTSPFTEPAKEYVKDKKNWIEGRPIDLIEESPKGYYAIWIS